MIRLAKISLTIVLLCLPSLGYAEVIPLTEGEYRLGDSPQTPEAGLAWLSAELNSPEWRPFKIADGHPSKGFDHAWRRFVLPEQNVESPNLLIRDSPAFEAYLGGRLVHKSGQLHANSQNKVRHHTWHLIPLPDGFAGKTLFVRVYSEHAHWLEHPSSISVGSSSEHFMAMVRRELSQTIASAFLLLIGLGCLYIYIRRREAAARSLAILSGCVGLYSMMHTDIAWMILTPSLLTWYVSHIPLFVFPVGLWLFLSDLVAGQCAVLKKLSIVQAVIAVIAVLLDVTNVYPMIMTTPYLIILSLSLVVSAAATFYFLHQNRSLSSSDPHDRRMVLVGYGILTLAASHDLLAGFRLIPFLIPLFHFGVLGFVISLATILERRFARAHDRLEEANRTLELRVEERTADLATKNVDLERAMVDLRNTQQQLVMREKMASLGDLVAGVAHEVNTPIGAVNSSADVANRCIEKLKGVIGQSTAAEELRANPPYQQAIQILKDNAGLIRSAGERIATIVRSLRSFARLDEAEYQSADIHVGLDSTLDLVNHQFRNRIEIDKNYGDLPMIDCFPNKLNQVFMNLLINGSQAIEGKGTISISTKQVDDEAVIRIADTGKGISPENLEKIFDPGFTTKGVGIGTGLGLAISYTIIEDHKGSIKAESELGRGTTFTIRLPVEGKVQGR